MKANYQHRIILFFLIFIFGCSSNSYQSPRYVKVAHEVTANTAQKLKKQKKLHLIGTGGGMMDSIQMMAMSFHYYNELTLEEARKLIIYSINEYLSDINNNEEIAPHLYNKPFTVENIEIRIFVYGPDRRELPPEKIYCITALDGTLRYYNRADKKHCMCKEAYQEALKITQ